jgi:hypothetical protein
MEIWFARCALSCNWRSYRYPNCFVYEPQGCDLETSSAAEQRGGYSTFHFTAKASAPMKRNILIFIVLGLIFVAGILGYGALTAEHMHSTVVVNDQGNVATHH